MKLASGFPTSGAGIVTGPQITAAEAGGDEVGDEVETIRAVFPFEARGVITLIQDFFGDFLLASRPYSLLVVGVFLASTRILLLSSIFILVFVHCSAYKEGETYGRYNAYLWSYSGNCHKLPLQALHGGSSQKTGPIPRRSCRRPGQPVSP